MSNIISKSYWNKLVLDKISLELDKACILIIGKNGSGKTTLFKIIAGLIKKFKGDIDYKNEVSILLDDAALFLNKTGNENLNYFLNHDEYEASLSWIKKFNMENYYNNKVKTYSCGMKKKLMLVVALSKNRKLLVLDEPTNGLDIESIKLLKRYLIDIKKNKKILIASHDISIFDIELIDSIYMLLNHKLVKKDIAFYNYTIFKVKTNLSIDDKYKYISKDSYYYFKINNDEIIDFSNFISKYIILEMTPLNYLDEMYFNEVYNEENV